MKNKKAEYLSRKIKFDLKTTGEENRILSLRFLEEEDILWYEK